MTTTTAPIAMTMGANVLVDGKLLSGSELTDYAKQRGLCSKCVQQVTHKRLKKRLGMRSEWIPITVKDTQARNYIVYKGYCIQPTCHTLAEAKALLGESTSTRSMSTGRPRPSPSGESERAKSVSRPRQENNTHSRLAPTGYHSERQLTVNARPKSPYHPDRQQSVTSSSPYHPEPIQNGRSRDRQDVSLLRGLVRSRMDTVNRDDGDINISFRSNASTDEISLGSMYTSDSESVSVYSKASGLSSVQPSSRRNLAKQASNNSISDVSERSSSKHRRSSLVENNVVESARDVHGTTRNAVRSSMFYRQPSISDSDSNDDLTVDISTNHSDEISQASKATRRQSIERVNLSSFVTKSRRRDLLVEPCTTTTCSEPENATTLTPSKAGRRKSIKVDISHLFRSPPSSEEKEELNSLVYPASTGLSLTNVQNEHAGNTKRRASMSCLPPKSPLLPKSALSTFRSISSTRDICRNEDKDSLSFDPMDYNTTEQHTKRHRDASSQILGDHLLDDNSSSSREDAHPRIFTDATDNDDSHSLSSRHRRDNFGEAREVSSLVKSLFVPFSGSSDKAAEGEADYSLPTIERDCGELAPVDTEEVAAPDLKEILSMHYHSAQVTSCMKKSKPHEPRDISLVENGIIVPEKEKVKIEPRLITAPCKENSEVRRFISDTSILEQLCSLIANKSMFSGQQSVSTSSTDHLWASLHTRYGDVALPLNTNVGKIASVLNFLSTVENDCLENCWTLISHLNKVGDTSDKRTLCSTLGLAIVERTRVEFERQDFTGNVKLLAAATLYNIIEIEKATSDKKVTLWVQSMTKTNVLQWIAVLCDTLNFRDYSQSEQRGETADAIHLLCHLLDVEIVGFKEHHKNSEWIHSMNSLFEISISILSMDCFELLSINNEEERESGKSASLALCEAALHLMSSVLSQNTLSSVKGRQVECFRLILNVMNKYACGGVMYQGLLASRHILATCKSADSFNGGIYDDATSNVLAADKLTEMALVTILYERHNPSQSLSIECISIVSRLFETNDIMRVIAEKSVIVQRPMLVEAILRLIDTSDNIMIIDKAFFLLLFHITKCSISGMNLRQSKSIHSRVVQWLHMYQGDLSLLEYICLILEYLVASDEDSFGQEFCIVGGATALSNLIRTSVRGSSIVLVTIAARALVETLSAVEKSFLTESWVTVKDDMIDAMNTDFKHLALQLACLDVIDCLYARKSSGVIIERSGIIDTMARSMEIHFEDVVLLSKCCSIIRKAVLCSAEFAAIAETDTMKKVVNMLIAHPTSTDLLLEVLVTIKELAAIKELRRHFNFDDAEVAIVSIFPIHMQNPDFVSFALASLHNVVFNPTSRNVALMQVDVLDYIIFAMTEFRENSGVITNACLLLDCYTHNDTNVQLIRSFSKPIKQLLMELSEKPTAEIRDPVRHIIQII